MTPRLVVGTCSFCKKADSPTIKSAIANKFICVQCVHKVKQSAGIEPPESITCLSCGQLDSFKAHGPSPGSFLLFIRKNIGVKDSAQYLVGHSEGSWSSDTHPIKFSCPSCDMLIAPWMVYQNQSVLSIIPKNNKVAL